MINEQDVRNRIEDVMSQKGLNPRSVSGEDVNFYQKAYLQLAKGKTLTLPIILALLEKVPDLSTEWLFRGVGEPFVADVVDNMPIWAASMEKRIMEALEHNEKKAFECDSNNSEGNVQVKIDVK